MQMEVKNPRIGKVLKLEEEAKRQNELEQLRSKRIRQQQEYINQMIDSVEANLKNTKEEQKLNEEFERHIGGLCLFQIVKGHYKRGGFAVAADKVAHVFIELLDGGGKLGIVGAHFVELVHGVVKLAALVVVVGLVQAGIVLDESVFQFFHVRPGGFRFGFLCRGLFGGALRGLFRGQRIDVHQFRQLVVFFGDDRGGGFGLCLFGGGFRCFPFGCQLLVILDDCSGRSKPASRGGLAAFNL